MLHIRVKLIFALIGFVFLVGNASAADWANAFSQCPTSAQSQTCPDDDRVCGLDGGITYCADPGAINVPSANSTTTSNVDDEGFDGGFLIDCEDYDGSAPMCDNSGNYWCDRNSNIHSTQLRQTICLGSASGGDFGEVANGTCRSGYYNCYGTGISACESTSTSDCENSNNNHYTVATCETDYGTAPSATCVCDTNYFECDGSETDADGCEIQSGVSCGSGTGTVQLDECFDANNGNCTRNSDYLDCDDDDSDGNELTCNAGNGCEVNPQTTDYPTGANNHYEDCSTCGCDTGWLDCNAGGCDAGDGCEIQEGASCLNSTSTAGSNGTYATGQCFGTVGGNCTASGSLDTWLDCDDSDGDGNVFTCNTGNGCEVLNNSVCTVGAVSGTINMCSGGAGNCVVDAQDIGTTGVEVAWSGTDAMLWLNQYGSGLIANFTGASGYFHFETDGDLIMSSNLTLGDKITFSLGEVIDNLVDGVVRVTGDLLITGNVEATNYTLNGTTIHDWDEIGGAADGQGLVDTDGFYLYDNGTRVFLNESQLNDTIDARDTDTTIGNCSGDQSCTNILYNSDLPLENKTISHWNNVTGKPANLDTDSTDDITTSNIGDQNVNSSDYWDNLDTINTTQMENNGGTLNFLESWLTAFVNSWFSGKTTDDLTEGSTNLYDNKSWNQSHADTLYAPVGAGGGNPFDQTLNKSSNVTFDQLNITGGITMVGNSTIKREGVDTETWISETGNMITKFG